MNLRAPRRVTLARLAALVQTLLVAAALTHCTLFLSLDGLTGGGGQSGDADSSTAPDGAGAEAGSFVPSGAVTPGDLAATGTRKVTLVDTTTIHTDTGAIDGVRPAGPGVVNGIGFRTSGSLAIFTFAELTVDAPTVRLDGLNAVALVTAGNLILHGNLDAQGACVDGGAGPGGSVGGNGGPGAGTGGGGAGAPAAGGGGGGGFGAAGGAGGAGGYVPGSAAAGVAGTGYGTVALVPLVGGSGGGAGSGGSYPSVSGIGGGGGGALQLVAGDTVVIDGMVNAGGCGGTGGTCTNNCGGSAGGSGGGGGSGGAILVEAPIVRVTGVLAANGGGGGGGSLYSTPADGRNALGSASPAPGGASGAGGPGAVGGAAGSVAGAAGGAQRYAGGGGGGAGRIRINTRTGATDITGVLSPAPGDAVDGGNPLATFGTIGAR